MRKAERAGLPAGQTVKGNTVVIRLKFSEGVADASEEEKTRIERLMDEVDGLLVEPESTATPAGCLEGNEYVEGECRLFLSCPDADLLVVKLWPWLKSLKWDGKLLVMKRYGEYIDTSAPEEYVNIAADLPPKVVKRRSKDSRIDQPEKRDRPLNESEQGEVESFLAKGYNLLGMPADSKPDDLQEAIQTWLSDYRAKKRSSPMDTEDTSLALGCVWGQALCKSGGWQWAAVDRGKSEMYGVVSSGREYAVFPMQNIHAILITPLLGFNTFDVYKLAKSVATNTQLPQYCYQILS